mmetsp:Transcript_18918/g.27199  ORF Transcript_18918/g.27199 Transcript_18918/m.27199 type:complete len:119 (-) Transcript_18918:20-376(-)
MVLETIDTIYDLAKPGTIHIRTPIKAKFMMEEMIGRAVTPATPHLFQVCEVHRKILIKEDAERFHHYVAQLLFWSQHGRPDIRTAISFLCTQVKQSLIQMTRSKPNGGSTQRMQSIPQ